MSRPSEVPDDSKDRNLFVSLASDQQATEASNRTIGL